MVGRIFRRFETGEFASRQIASGPLHLVANSTLDISRAAPHRVPLRFLTEARIPSSGTSPAGENRDPV